ncbi:hypothetical protein ACUSIJ_24835 [Pseudochelatococcus sp. B33]
MTNITRITNERAMELTGATLPCPPLCAPLTNGSDSSPYLDRLNLRVASALALADLNECHKPGAGELDIPRGYGNHVRIHPIVRSLSGSALAGSI